MPCTDLERYPSWNCPFMAAVSADEARGIRSRACLHPNDGLVDFCRFPTRAITMLAEYQRWRGENPEKAAPTMVSTGG